MIDMLAEMPVDPVLGDLRAGLAPSRVLAACREGLTRASAEQRESWKSARVIEALYTPGLDVRVAYALLHDPQIPEERIWPEAEIVYLSAPRRATESGRGEILRIGEHEFEAYHFPNDRRLRRVRKFQGKADAVAAWQGWLDDAGDDFRIDSETLQRRLVRYVPEQKWIIRLRAEGAEGATGSSSKRRIAVLAAGASHCETVCRRHRALSSWARSNQAPFSIPDVVGRSPDDDLVGLEWLRGESLLSTLTAGADDVLSRIADALHAFHEIPASVVGETETVDIAGDTHAAIQDLCAAIPEKRAELRALEREFARELSRTDPVERRLLHNDFHWNQVTIKPSRLVLLDLDCIGIGDPLIDAANFAAQVALLGHRPEFEVARERAAEWSSRFLEAWGRTSGQDGDPDRMRIYTTASLMRLARGMMRHLRPGWRELLGTCIDLAQRNLSSLGVRT